MEAVESRSNFGVRWGHFYSKRLVEEVLGLGDEGVVRVSLVHYNTGEFGYLVYFCKFDYGWGKLILFVLLVEEEVREFVKVLDKVLAG